jgi:AbrB family looped-hinge helix DNA binding protein
MAHSSNSHDDPKEHPASGVSGGHHFSWDDHFFGSVTVGERGQVVVPAEARKRFGIEPGDRLLVMAAPGSKSVMLCRMDDLREFMNTFQEGLSRVERETASADSIHTGNSEEEK